MLVRDIMSSPAVAIPAATTLADAYRVMREKGIRHLPVVEGQETDG
jgi:acetoin utilization protein AcuB